MTKKNFFLCYFLFVGERKRGRFSRVIEIRTQLRLGLESCKEETGFIFTEEWPKRRVLGIATGTEKRIMKRGRDAQLSHSLSRNPGVDEEKETNGRRSSLDRERVQMDGAVHTRTHSQTKPSPLAGTPASPS